MYNNPILKAIKARSLSTLDDTSSVSSHGSAQASVLSAIKPPIANVSRTNRSRWWNAGDSAARYFVDPSSIKKERTRKTVEEWLWDARSGDARAVDEIDEELLFTKAALIEGEKTDKKPVFDLSKKDLAMSTTFRSRPSTPFPTLWDDEAFKDQELTVTENEDSEFSTTLLKQSESSASSENQDIPMKGTASEKNSFEQKDEDEFSPAFKNFLNQFKNGTTLSLVEESEIYINDPMRCDRNQVSTSCPFEYFYPDIRNLTCDLSAKSSESFWTEKYNGYEQIDVNERKKREKEDERALMKFQRNVIQNRRIMLEESFKASPYYQERSIDRAFITMEYNTKFYEVAQEEEAPTKVEDETDSNDDKSSGYIGSDARSRKEDSEASFSRPSSRDDTEALIMFRKEQCKATGRRRRYTSTPISSPDKSSGEGESLSTSLMPNPVPPIQTPNVSIIEDRID